MAEHFVTDPRAADPAGVAAKVSSMEWPPDLWTMGRYDGESDNTAAGTRIQCDQQCMSGHGEAGTVGE